MTDSTKNHVFPIARSFVLLSTFICLLCNCAVGPNYKRPETPSPQTYTSSNQTSATNTHFGKSQIFIPHQDVPKDWWKLFHSKSMNALIEESFTHNPSVGAAEEALRAALENVYAAQGAFYPSIGLSLSPTTQQTAKILTSYLASNKYIYPLYTGQVFVSYTADVFGGIRRQVASLKAQATFQALQLEATYLTLAANVANTAIQEAALHEEISATKTLIASQKRIVAIYQQQLHLGNTAIADLATQEAALAAAEATLPPLEKQLAIIRDALNALIGRLPDDKKTPSINLSSLHLPTHLPLSLPSALLEHRPDIRAAEEQMHAANELIGVAIANRLPNVSIGSTNGGYTATSLSTLFLPETQFWALAGIITHPIFEGGTLMHRQRLAEASYRQAANLYRTTVINAFQNVADALNAIKYDAIALQSANKAKRAAFKSLMISRRQLSLGDSSQLTLLINEQQYQQGMLNLIQAQANRLSDTVALFQALGGGWWHKDETLKPLIQRSKSNLQQ